MRTRFAELMSVAISVGVSLSVVTVQPTHASPGDRDPSFSGDGIVTNRELRLSSLQRPVLMTTDGLVLRNGAFGLARVNGQGELDPGFGDGGVTSVAIPGRRANLEDLAAAPTGAIVAAGSTEREVGVYDAVLVRFAADGRLDAEFGSGGILTIPTALDVMQILDFGVDASGRVTVLGYDYDRVAGREDFFARRYLADGTPDLGFGDDGIASLEHVFGERGGPTSMVVAGDGALTLGVHGAPVDQVSLAVLRISPSGEPDVSFSEDGFAMPPPGLNLTGGDVELTSDGGAIVASAVDAAPADPRSGDGAIVRFGPDGSLDTAFGEGGVAYVRLTTQVDRLDIEARAGGGWALSPAGTLDPPDFSLIALTQDGALDRSFSGDGRVRTDIGLLSRDSAGVVEVDSAGRIVVVGQAKGVTHVRGERIRSIAVVRYLDSPGRADADGDGVTDRKDACPQRYGEVLSGCWVLDLNRIVVHYQPLIDDFRGVVQHRPAYGCDRGLVIRIYRLRRGPDEMVGKSEPTEDYEGEFSVSALAVGARYYARVRPRLVPSLGYCEGGRSDVFYARG